MGVHEIAEKIKAEGEKEIQKIRDFYSRRVREIKSLEAESRKLFEEAEMAKIQREAEELKRGVLLTAKLNHKKAVLKAKRVQIERVFDQIKAHFKDFLGKEAYYRFLSEKAGTFSDPGDTILLSAEDMREFSGRLKGEVKSNIDFQESPIGYGLIIVKPNLNCNFSISALLEKRREEFEERIGKDLNVL